MTVTDEQIIQPVSLHIGNTVTVRLPPSTSDAPSQPARQSSATSKSHQNKQAIIKNIIDHSTYTVVFNDGDETSLRRASLCLQGIRLYQNHIGQSKVVQNVRPPSPPTTTTDTNEQTSIVCVRRPIKNNLHAFPALILKRKALPDYLWVRSFLDGKEYVVHQRDDVQPYRNNTEMQALCRSTSKQATQACDKFIRYHQIPAIWQKKKLQQEPLIDPSDNEVHGNPSDNESDEETTEEKDSFLAKLLAFMDERGNRSWRENENRSLHRSSSDTPINNIPKIHNYDLDLHRLFKLVRLLGGSNKVQSPYLQIPLQHTTCCWTGDEESTVGQSSPQDGYAGCGLGRTGPSDWKGVQKVRSCWNCSDPSSILSIE